MGNEEMQDPLDAENFSTALRMRATVEEFTRRMEGGSGLAAYNLAFVFDTGNMFVPDELKDQLPASDERTLELYRHAYDLLLVEAAAGNGEAMHRIAQYYQCGMSPVDCDTVKSLEWCERAVAAGYLFAANDLYTAYATPGGSHTDKAKAKATWALLQRENVCVVARNPLAGFPMRIRLAAWLHRLKNGGKY